MCHDSEDGRIEISNFRGGYAPYLVILDSDTSQVGVFEGLDPGIKSIQVFDHFGCMEPSEVALLNPPLFVLNSLRDTQLVLGEPLTIDLEANQPVVSALAEPDILQNCMDCNSVTFVPTSSTDIRITVLNANGCAASQRFAIEVDDENLPISFPNAFLPNGDGINDDFRIIAPPHLIDRILSARILDKWGDVVHSLGDSSNNSDGVLWDGVIENQDAPPGVYAYVCEVVLINSETRLYSGEVTLIK